ncbi:MAG TPA: hypothetical protein VKQ52_22440 [Puia sp.]|nr:hypothetical protein [Puia sp.]
MKKLLFVLLCLGFSAAVFAQTDQTKKAEMKDLRSDVRAHKAATHKVNHDLAHVRVSKAMQDHKAVHRLNKDENSDAKRLKEQGVSHPVTKAKRQVKVQEDNRKDHTGPGR